MMHVSTARLTLLRCIPSLARCTDSELAALDAEVYEIEVLAGTALPAEGIIDGDDCVIVEGWAAITVRGEPVAALGPGQLVGRGDLLEMGRADAIVVAKTPMRVLALHKTHREAER